MSAHPPLSHYTDATFSMSGPDDKMYVRAPDIHRDFIGKRSVFSPWMVSGSNMIPGHLLYDDIRSLSGTPTTAVAEIVVRKLVVEFKAFKPEQDSEVLVAIFKSEDDVGAMVTTTSDGNWVVV